MSQEARKWRLRDIYWKIMQASRLTRRAFRKVFTWRRSFTLSIGATAVLEMAAEIPPAKKSFANEIACSLMLRCSWFVFQVTSYDDVTQLPCSADGLCRRNGRLWSRVRDLFHELNRDTLRELENYSIGQSFYAIRFSANKMRGL